MRRITALVSAILTLAVATPASAVNVRVDSRILHPDGSRTFAISIESRNEVSFLDMTIRGYGSGLRQNPGGPTYTVISPSPWRPAVVFRDGKYGNSDVGLADGLGEGYDLASDTFVYDDRWPGKVAVELDPANDGSNSVHIAMASFRSIGSPLPGGFIPLAQVTVERGGFATVSGALQSDSDHDGSFYFVIPEPASALLAGWGTLALLLVRQGR